jgi:predicted RNA-binding protein with EMAP domain
MGEIGHVASNFENFPFTAQATIGNIYRFAKQDTADNLSVNIAGDGGDAIGVFTNTASSGEKVPVSLGANYLVPVEAGGSISLGDNIASDASGRAVTAAGGDVILGKAMSAVSNAGEYIIVLFYGEHFETA